MTNYILSNQFDIILNNIYLFFNILVVLCFCLHFGTSTRHRFPIVYNQTSLFGCIMLLFTFLLTVNNPFGNQFLFYNIFVQNNFILFLQSTILLFSTIILVISNFYLKEEKYNLFEPIVLILISILAMMFLLNSFDLMAIYLCIELQSFCFYILAAIRRKNIYSIEAGLKYFILGSFSSSFLIFGFSFLYGFTGLTNIEDLINLYTQFQYLQQYALVVDSFDQLFVGTTLGAFFILTGLFFKIYAAPFHFWIIDIYQGAPTFMTAFFATIPNFVLLYVFLRILDLFYHTYHIWYYIVLFVGILSLVLGSIGAIYQRTIKRLIAYSSVTHMGYFLLFIALYLKQGLYTMQFLFVYLILYVITTLGIFTIILMLYKHKHSNATFIEYFMNFANLYKINPLLSWILSLFLFSVAGIPPLPGFFAKLFLFTSIMYPYFRMIVFFVTMILTIISCYYYLRIVKIIYFSSLSSWLFFKPVPYSSSILLILLTFSLLAFLCAPEYFQTPIYYYTLKFF
uniref:NADH dehydrogenase subunit 2 n=1 Tax=Eukaryota sp. BB2 TaxID=1949062 RepID=A0A1W5QGT6_9EUKA|nr:NADH dehydrogenase subunit 2 [Eukaryota sp. BB2]AQL10455.1 NADH dehydrogenase subunit 2 [Eukaryota sp. BB2]